jgi:ribose transport system permease protein
MSATEQGQDLAIASPGPRRRLLERTHVDSLSGLYAWLVLIAVFAVIEPSTFLTVLTLRTTLADYSVTGLLALGALVPFAAGLIDLSFASVAGLGMLVGTWLSIHTGLSGSVITLIVVCCGAVIGLFSGLFVTRLRVNSLVTTLAVSTVALGLAELVSGGDTLTGNWSAGFQKLGQGYVWVIPVPALFLGALAVVLYFVIEHTTVGRRVLATGSNPAASRLAGLRVARIQVASLMVAGAVGAFAGVILSVQVGVATTETGPAYLLPAIAALFLGETQFKGRVNVCGTVLAVFLIGTGIKGLELLGTAPWVSDFFNGVVLLVAIGVAARARRGTDAARNT